MAQVIVRRTVVKLGVERTNLVAETAVEQVVGEDPAIGDIVQTVASAMYATGMLRRFPRPRGARPTTPKEVRSEVAICSVRLPAVVLPARVNNDVSTRAGA